jgi:hypothetical protein
MWGWARRGDDRRAGAPKTKMKTIVLRHEAAKRTARPLTILMAAVSLILLIATANVATLLSSRAAARQREIGLRTALGATNGRVLRQLLTESVALALLGAVAGIGLAVLAVRAFTHSSLVSLPRIAEVSVDGRVLAVTLAVSVLSGILFGLLPALHGVRTQSSSDLNAGQREFRIGRAPGQQCARRCAAHAVGRSARRRRLGLKSQRLAHRHGFRVEGVIDRASASGALQQRDRDAVRQHVARAGSSGPRSEIRGARLVLTVRGK